MVLTVGGKVANTLLALRWLVRTVVSTLRLFTILLQDCQERVFGVNGRCQGLGATELFLKMAERLGGLRQQAIWTVAWR
jgi:hypothetical protein